MFVLIVGEYCKIFRSVVSVPPQGEQPFRYGLGREHGSEEVLKEGHFHGPRLPNDLKWFDHQGAQFMSKPSIPKK